MYALLRVIRVISASLTCASGTQAHTHTFRHTHRYTQAHTHGHTQTHAAHTDTHTRAHTSTRTRAHTGHTHKHTHTRARTHTDTRTGIHRHTLTLGPHAFSGPAPTHVRSSMTILRRDIVWEGCLCMSWQHLKSLLTSLHRRCYQDESVIHLSNLITPSCLQNG